MTASGACRDGVPNGMYELRTPDGKLRVAGAFAMARRTGTFLFWTPAGARIAVIPYDDNVRSGTVAAWYVGDRAATESSHRLEAPFVAGERHGTSRSWYDTGRPRGEYVYERGRLVDARGWTEAGKALSASAARAQADRDRRRDDRFIESLERLVAVHEPRCA
jgi:antitoxin component YwqK of YwqJK toxin-antitoxin module